MDYFNCRTKQDYVNKASQILEGIKIILNEINSVENKEERLILCDYYKKDLRVLQEAFILCTMHCKDKYKGLLED